MKYWNTGKHTRERHWTRVSIESIDPTDNALFMFKKERVDYIKRELQKMPSNGKFYISVRNYREVWFENSKDAVYVLLKGIPKWL